jgi:hypothetical protein
VFLGFEGQGASDRNQAYFRVGPRAIEARTRSFVASEAGLIGCSEDRLRGNEAP